MERNIFKYNNGLRDVFGDPLILRDRLFQVSQGEFHILRGKVRAIAKALPRVDTEPEAVLAVMEGLRAREHLVNIAREVFQLAPFDDTTGKGTLADECLAVTEAFLAFCAEKKTTGEQQPTTSTSTESTLQQPIPETTPTM